MSYLDPIPSKKFCSMYQNGAGAELMALQFAAFMVLPILLYVTLVLTA